MATSAKGAEISELHSLDVRSISSPTTYCLSITRNTRSGEPRLEVQTAVNGSAKSSFHTLIPFQAMAGHFARVRTPFICLDDENVPMPFSVLSKHWKQASVMITTHEGWYTQPCQHG